MTTTSGPGMALKMEFVGLAIMVELPLVIVDIQRGGPSTGLPTKTEQADLFQAMFGRPSEAPCIVIAARSASDCFQAAYEATRLAIKHMTPVILLSDGYIANGAEPWMLPKIESVRRAIDSEGVDCWLQVDGGVNAQTAGRAARAGADSLVAGSAFFGAPDAAGAFQAIAKAAQEGVGKI